MPGDELVVEAWRWILARDENEKACRQSRGREGDPRLWKPRSWARSPAAHRFKKGLGLHCFLFALGGNRRSYPVSQRRRCIETQAPILEQLLLSNDFAIRGCACTAAAQMLLHRKRICRVKFAIGETMEKKLALRARARNGIHHRISFIGKPFQSAANILRARARRDMTVPIGTPVMSAISR